MMNVLVLNAGSSSVKYRLIDSDTGETLLGGTIERLEGKEAYDKAFERILGEVKGHSIHAVGHRVVHGGSRYASPTLVNDEVIADLESLNHLAPLHNPHNLAGLRAAEKALPNLPHVLVFDTAFSARLPRRAKTYALDPVLAEQHDIRRYGFHGPSHEWVASLAADALMRPLESLRLVSLHLGNGASACAIEYGHVTETSMGMTPLEGLVMGTRSGDIDPGVIFTLMRKGMSAAEVENLLQHQSGLSGLSGIGNDLRDIQARAEDGDERCRLAIQVFSHRVRKYIGAYAATMGGLDAVVLTAGIGENSASMRRRILQRFDYLGLVLDEDRNRAVKLSDEAPSAIISARHSRIAALAVLTNEEWAIAKKTAALVRGRAQVQGKGIPIAVSARHLHLDRQTMDLLFGKGSELTVFREISQPGQFAAEEKVNLIGPRGRIDNVRIIGPLRARPQVEIARTDEFRLGVDAPIRESGHLDGAAPITLEGPLGTVHLEEALICAKRHIHMHPDDAKAFGVEDQDEVEVRLEGGERGLIFSDVVVRVSPQFKLEMHVDTDEANAAEIQSGSTGNLVYSQTGSTASMERRKIRHEHR